MAHPLHPILVHFPIACWALATMADVGNFLFNSNTWMFSGTVHLIGSSSAIITMIAGIFDFAKISETETQTIRLVNFHIGSAITTWCLYATSLFLRLEEMQLSAPDIISFSLSIIGFISLGITGWLGGTLVYKYQIGARRQ